MSEAFEREIRYDVTKIKTGRKVQCVVVEHDWPEYEIVWNMLADRMQGKPNRIVELLSKIEQLNHDLANERCANTLLQAAYDALECRWNKLVNDKAK